MPITPTQYVPLLRWRMGEYQALERLVEQDKSQVVPLLEILEPDFDFEKRRLRKNLDEHLGGFAPKLAKKWGGRLALLDGGQLSASSRMNDKRHPLAFVFDEARRNGAALVPVTGLERDGDYQRAVRAINKVDNRGVALRVTLDEVIDPDFGENFEKVLQAANVNVDDLDTLLDLKSPTFEPEEGLVVLVKAALENSQVLGRTRSLTLLATSFPDSMSGFTAPLQYVPRREWLLYRTLIQDLGSTDRIPSFGDYGIAAVSFAKGDMRFMRGSPNVRYAVDDGWLVAKAKRAKNGGNEAYPNLCTLLASSPKYLGHGFSPGSAYVNGCSLGTEKRGNPTTWKWVGTNHHITKIVRDLAMIHGV